MSLYKQQKSNHWYVRFTTPTGKLIRRSTGTANRKLAERFEAELKAAHYRNEVFGDKPEYTWKDAVTKWIQEQGHKRSLRTDIGRLRWLDQHLRDEPLSAIDRNTIRDIGDIKARESSVSTANRHMALIRSILNKAYREWEWIDRVPHIKLLPEPKARVRFLTKEEAQRLIRELPDHLAEMVRFSLATGLRAANVMELEWSQVDLTQGFAWIHADQSKSRRAIPVPLNDQAIAVIRRQIGKHDTHVFSYRYGKNKPRRPVKQLSTAAWYKALERANIKNFRWHDLRHTFATWHRQNGTPLDALKELLGHSEISLTMRYAHITPERLKEFARNSEWG